MPGRVREGSRWPKMKCSTSGVSIKAGALRVLRNLDPASLNVLLGCQAEGEGMAASFRLRLRDGTFKAFFPRVQRDLLNFLSTKTGKIKSAPESLRHLSVAKGGQVFIDIDDVPLWASMNSIFGRTRDDSRRISSQKAHATPCWHTRSNLPTAVAFPTSAKPTESFSAYFSGTHPHNPARLFSPGLCAAAVINAEPEPLMAY